MKRKDYSNIPKSLVPVLSDNPDYFLESHRIVMNHSLANATVHIRMPIQHESKLRAKQNLAFRVMSRYTPSIEISGDEMIANLVSLIRFDPSDLCDLLLSCAFELSKIHEAYVGVHLGEMLAVPNPNGFEYPHFEGDQMKVGLIMGDLALRFAKPLVASDNVYSVSTKKDRFVRLGEVDLRWGQKLILYELK